MSKKQKIKLTEEQKEWAENLQWYVNNAICWVGASEDSVFKEAALDGNYAVISYNGESEWDCFDSIICTDSINSAKVIAKWNLSSLFRIVDLKTLCMKQESRRPYSPNFDMLVRKWEQDAIEKRYNELKKSLKPVLKYFKGLR